MKRMKFFDAGRPINPARKRVRDEVSKAAEETLPAGADIIAEYDFADCYPIVHAGRVLIVRKQAHTQTTSDRMARTIQSINAANKAHWNQK